MGAYSKAGDCYLLHTCDNSEWINTFHEGISEDIFMYSSVYGYASLKPNVSWVTVFSKSAENVFAEASVVWHY